MAVVRSLRVLEGYNLELTFDDGTTRVVDIEPFLRGPVFEVIRNDPEYFRAVRIDHVLGTIAWPNGADICPDVLRHGRTPASMIEEC